jgi:hypothetical protein
MLRPTLALSLRKRLPFMFDLSQLRQHLQCFCYRCEFVTVGRFLKQFAPPPLDYGFGFRNLGEQPFGIQCKQGVLVLLRPDVGSSVQATLQDSRLSRIRSAKPNNCERTETQHHLFSRWSAHSDWYTLGDESR